MPRKVSYGQPGYKGCSMSAGAAEAYSEGLLPATAAARKYGFKSAAAVRRFFRPCEWHHTGAYAAPTDFFDIEEEVSTWTTLSDVPRGIWGHLTRRGRAWLLGVCREIIHFNLDLSPSFPHRQAAEIRIADNLLRLVGNEDPWEWSQRKAAHKLAEQVKSGTISFHEAVEALRKVPRDS